VLMQPKLLSITVALPFLLGACVQNQPVAPQVLAPVQTHAAPAAPPTPVYTASAPATWQRAGGVRTQTLPLGVKLDEFQVHSAEGAAEVQVVVFDSRQCVLRVVDQPGSQGGGGVISGLMRQSGALAGVNGGFFHPDFQPLGIFIASGQRHGQFMTNRLLSGSVLMVGQEPYLVWNSEFLGERGVTDMIQCGPRLVDGGLPVAGLNRVKKAARTFVATDGKRAWAIGVVRSTTLGGMADLLASPGLLPDMQVQRALNLDGGHSSALYARLANGQEISRPGWSTVRNYLAVVPR